MEKPRALLKLSPVRNRPVPTYLTLSEVVKTFRLNVVFKPRKLVALEEVADFSEGNLYDEVQTRLKKAQLKRFRYFVLRIDDLTGNKLLRTLVDVVNDKTHYIAGNCVLLSLNLEYVAAIVIMHTHAVEMITVSQLRKKEKRVFNLIYNDYYCQVYKQKNDIREWRMRAKENLLTFLQNNVVLTEEPLRSTFLRVLHHIALSERLFEHIPTNSRCYSNIPTAAGVFIASETYQSGKLYRLFGINKLPMKLIKQKINDELPAEKFNKPRREKLKKKLVEHKALYRIDAMKEIIANSYFHEETEMYHPSPIENTIKDLKAVYQLEDQPSTGEEEF